MTHRNDRGAAASAPIEEEECEMGYEIVLETIVGARRATIGEFAVTAHDDGTYTTSIDGDTVGPTKRYLRVAAALLGVDAHTKRGALKNTRTLGRDVFAALLTK